MTRFVPLILMLCACLTSKAQTEEKAVKQTVINFLNWYKKAKVNKDSKPYSLVKDVNINKSLKRQVIDKKRVEKHLDFFRRSNYISETYLDDMRRYYYRVAKYLEKSPPLPINEFVKIDGLDQDVVLDTYEPEAVLDNINKVTITKSLIVYRKALLSINFSKELSLEFVLTKYNKRWLIDYLGPDNTSMESFFRQ